jgi:hypothetical protein
MDKENNKTEKLNENLEALNGEIKKTNSLKSSLMRGMFFGVGTTLGATIVAAIIIAVLVWISKTFDNTPVVGDILDWLNIDKYINDVR